MKAFVLINSSEPGLIPWGIFDLLLPGIKTGVAAFDDVDPQTVFSEWLFELYLDDLRTSALNTVLKHIDEHAHNSTKNKSDHLKSFWNNVWMPIVECEHRYRGACTSIL